ncbi:hypothetical protein ACFQ0T_28520 [Kitasatospora gansuensis]
MKPTLRQDPVLLLSLGAALLLLLLTVAAPLVAPYDPAAARSTPGCSTPAPPGTCSAPTARAGTCSAG